MKRKRIIISILLITAILICTYIVYKKNSDISDNFTGVIVKKVKLENPSFENINNEDDKNHDISNFSQEYWLKKGDIVVVLDDSEDFYKVILPLGTVPKVQGYLNKDYISFNKSDILNANQCVVENGTLYSMNGNIVDSNYNGYVTIKERKNNKIIITDLVGGIDGDYYIEEGDIHFDFSKLAK